MKKELLETGLNGLLNMQEPTPAPKKETTVRAKEQKQNCKPFSYSIPVELAEKISYIAYYDRRKVSAVVVEAFEDYVEKWNGLPHIAEKAKKL